MRADNMKAKEFKRVIHQSLIQSGSEKSFILDLILSLELYLMMGIVDHLITIVGGKWQDLLISLKEMKIVSQPYHDGQFEGPEC